MDDLTFEARFAEQIAGDFPAVTLDLPGGIHWTRHPRSSIGGRLHVGWLWLLQGRPRHRATIVTIGVCWQDVTGGWHSDGWTFDGTFCPGIPALDVETVGGQMLVRAVCGWHLPDLQRAGSRSRVRRRWIW